MHIKILFSASVFTLLLIVSACNNSNTTAKEPAGSKKQTAPTNDTLSNEPQCSITIDDKEFAVSEDSISTGYSFSDSTLGVTIKGIDGGRVVFTMPNFFKCPCKISTGYSNINTKIAGTEEYAMWPTLELYDYPIRGISFRNLNDGYHEKGVTENAMEIMAIEKINENTTTNWAEFLIKGRIHTTVLKNVYESAAGDKNKDYTVAGSFVIKSKIYF
ncbi:MAG: hypothetical protein IPN82_13270 [Chitinophagaceae bacterium]|nr:hypothetical protein [Chitinophagaceae bacterium]MBK8607728.1 hypothetical protein [Chitinophagaceae bacterium]MBP6477602.1 hypothetical protein [Chitinophagaceae bacterium]MBP7107120.1 hypothetical protein [Chitinophagaceae bacterium]MBP7314881.1 hypothetical protein [Chitinophagaceae bacterium]